MKPNQQGLTLLEVMISVLIFSMISVLIFSILDRSVVFTAKGEKRVRSLEQHYSLTNLVRKQVQGAFITKSTITINTPSDHQFSIITTASIMYPPSTLIVAFYDFDPQTGILYYTERRDFYNLEYGEQFPAIEEMIPLLTSSAPFSLERQEDSNWVTLKLAGKTYTFHPFCIQQDTDNRHATRS